METVEYTDEQIEQMIEEARNNTEYLPSLSKYPNIKIPLYIGHFDAYNLDWITDIYLVAMEDLAKDEDFEYANLYDWITTNIFPDIEFEAHRNEISWGLGVLQTIDSANAINSEMGFVDEEY